MLGGWIGKVILGCTTYKFITTSDAGLCRMLTTRIEVYSPQWSYGHQDRLHIASKGVEVTFMLAFCGEEKFGLHSSKG